MEKIILPKSNKSTRFSNKNEIIVSSRIRIARNIDALAFPSNLSFNEKRMIEHEIQKILMNLNDNTIISCNIRNMDSNARVNMIADLSITDEFEEFGDIYFAKKNGDWIILPNEKDHIRIFSIDFGLRLKEIYKRIQQVIVKFDDKIHFAYHPEFGYITSFVDHAGNGLSLSLLINLCGLELQGKIENLASVCEDTGYILQPLTGKKDSKYFFIKNKSSFGMSESEQIEQITYFVYKLQQLELQARDELLEKQEDIDFFVSQILQTLSRKSIDYTNASEFIALIEMLGRKVYKITHLEEWQRLIFSLTNNSSLFNSCIDDNEVSEYRAKFLSRSFHEFIKLQ